MSSKKDNKRSGAVYEYKFFAKAMDKGLEVFVPAGDHLPQDCHVVNKDGVIFRVQVKGTGLAVDEGVKRKIPRFRLSTFTGTKVHSPINCNDVDVVVGYVAPLDLFYIIPCQLLNGTTTWVYPNDPKTKSFTEIYREKWDVFTGA